MNDARMPTARITSSGIRNCAAIAMVTVAENTHPSSTAPGVTCRPDRATSAASGDTIPVDRFIALSRNRSMLSRSRALTTLSLTM